MTLAEAVVDASAMVRALTTDGEAADLFAEMARGNSRGHAPELIVAEVSSALSVAVRHDRRSLEDAHRLLGVMTATPIRLHALTPLAPSALELAAAGNLSAYDSFYAVLAAALDVPLVTADRRLAEAVPSSVLVA